VGWLDAFQIPWFLYTSTLLFGLVVGSFFNVVILRLPRIMEQTWRAECCELLEQTPPGETRLSLSSPPSRCPGCDTRIRPWQNIPVISFLLLRGRCGGCGMAISMRYPLVELCTGLLSLCAALAFGPTVTLVSALILIGFLIVLTGIDIDTCLLPDSLTLPLLWLGLLVNVAGVFCTLVSAVIGAAMGYLSLWSIYWLFKLTTGKEGMGYGDFKLLAALGAWFGWEALPLIIILSSFVGAFLGISLVVLRRHERDAPMPFGPYLAGAGLLTLFYGEALTTQYYALLGF
jgi:leader peptidase (prepilin peptidase)/N-methyltransferase